MGDPLDPGDPHGVSPAERGAVWRQAMSVVIPTGLYGISAGALATAAGLSIAQACALSLLIFSGGSQFAFIGVIGAAGPAGGAAAIASSTLLGVRNGFYGLSLAQRLGVRGWRRVAAAHVTIDESTAVGIVQPRTALQRLGFWITGLGVFVTWNLFTLLGAILGDRLGDPRVYGLDAAAAAAFCGLLWPRLRSRDAAATAALAAFIAILLVPAVPAGVPVIVAGVAALVVGLWPRAADREQATT